MKPSLTLVQNANASLALAFPGLALCLSSSPRPPGGIDVCFVYPLVTGDLWSIERSSPQVTVDHRAKAGPGFAHSHLYLRKFCFVVLATPPRADHFKPASHVDCRITGPPCAPRDQMRGWNSAGDSALALCNYWACRASQLMCQSLQSE